MFTGLIKNNKLFYKVNESDINLLLTSENIITKMKGEVVYKEGENGDSVYLIIAGEICIAKERFLGRVKKENKLVNDFFGEESYLEKIPRPFTAYAINECKLIQLDTTKLEQFISVNNQFLYNLKRTPEEAPVEETVNNEVTNISTEDNTVPQVVEPQVVESQVVEPQPALSQVLEDSFGDVQLNQPEIPVDVISEIIPDQVESLAVPENPFELVPVEDNSETEPLNISETISEEHFEITPDYSYEIKNDGLYEIPQTSADDFTESTPDPVITNKDLSDIPAEHEPTVITLEDIIKEVKPEVPKDTNVKIFTDAPQAEVIKPDELTSEHLRLIIQAAQSVNSNIKIDDVLQSIVDAARNLTLAERGTLYLVDKEREEVWSKVLDGNELREIRLKFGEGIAGWVVNNKEIVNIKDVQYDHRFNDQIDHVSGFHTKNMLCFPICNKADEVIGVLQLLNSTKGEFTVMDEEYLKMLSINAALALENAGLVEKLLQSERITSLGKMANFLIQDIKKPVLVSKRYAEHLKNKNLSPEINQVIDMLLEQLTHVADLVQTTSSFSEGKTILHSAACQLNEALGEILSKLESYVTIHNCKLIKEFGSDAKVKLDRKEFYQCCMHIIRNACDAMPEGGVITVATKSTIDSASIIFKDNGLGIPDSIKEKIFEPFMSHGKKEGTGLGLSITKKIVEDHGGSISVESDIGEGATFIITLPTA